MKRVAAGAHLPYPWLFEPAKRPDDIEPTTAGTAVSFPSASTSHTFLQFGWTEARPWGEQW